MFSQKLFWFYIFMGIHCSLFALVFAFGQRCWPWPPICMGGQVSWPCRLDWPQQQLQRPQRQPQKPQRQLQRVSGCSQGNSQQSNMERVAETSVCISGWVKWPISAFMPHMQSRTSGDVGTLWIRVSGGPLDDVSWVACIIAKVGLTCLRLH